MISKNKSQALLRNERSGEQRIQGSMLGELRENNNKRPRHQAISPHSGPRNNIHSDNSSSKPSATPSTSSIPIGVQQTNKNNFVSLGSKTHSEQIQALTNLVTDLTLKVDKMSEVKPPENKETTHRTNTVWDDVSRVQKLRVKASLVVKPDEHGNIIKTKTVKKIATEQGIPIDSVVESSNGETFVNTPDVESRDKVLQCLEASHASNPVVKLKSKLPTITVMDVEARHLMNEDDQVVTKNELRENIYRLNKFITPLVDTGSELEVVYMKAPPTGKNFYSVYIRVSPDIRLTIDKKMGNKIHFGAKVFNIKDRFHVKRCNRCQGLGHYAEKCDTEKNPVKCGYCAKDHDSNECPEKGRPHERHTCTNCSDANRDGSGHPAFWTKCPTYKEAQDKLKKTIPYYNLN